ncbi:RAD9, HUS1, RAD1-interacting nuclear orphan protein 1 [Tamandua tetradactyla]|uniref:RAD9, HUS1, RAD1-interacting nuclear orphan protein 1 n=1 Tax=Tamandua tetradactyla TaxID=48850 RepID=UPI00405451FD
MPPRKKRRQRSQKAPLLFQQQPLEGPKHHSGSPQLPITHTKRVPSKPIDHSTITSWILPEFDMTAESWYPVNQKCHHQDQARHSSRKSAASKFPQLIFESPQSSSSSVTLEIPLSKKGPSQLAKDISGRPLVPMLSPQSSRELSVHALQSPGYVFIPPDIQTPESSVKKPIHPDQRKNSLPSCSLHSSTPKNEGPGPALVKDTPEEKYGIKVTWRRRKHLFAYLRDRGKLSRSQFLVKN